jgi:hypothetical protein
VAHGRRHALLVVPREDLTETGKLDARGFEIRGVGVREMGVDAPIRSMPVSIFRCTLAVTFMSLAIVSMSLSLSMDDAVSVNPWRRNRGI